MLAQTLVRGLDYVQQVINSNGNINSPEIRLADEINNQMTAYEFNSQSNLRPTILGLYLHFVLSLIGLIESSLKCILFSITPLAFGFLYIVLFSMYYIVLCISCGRTDGIPVINNFMEQTCKNITNSMSLSCLYVGILFGMIGNLFVPWNAPFSFYKTRVILKRPPGSKPINIEIECCNSIGIPKYIVCKKLLIVGGGFYSLFSSLLFEDYMRIIVSEYESEVNKDTIKFFQETYNCPSFEQLLYGGGRQVAYQPSTVVFNQQPQIQSAVAVPVSSTEQPVAYVQVAYQV